MGSFEWCLSRTAGGEQIVGRRKELVLQGPDMNATSTR